MKHFTRKGSCMYECNDLSDSWQDYLVHTLHSSEFVKWLEDLTEVQTDIRFIQLVQDI